MNKTLIHTQFIEPPTEKELLGKIELAGRSCYQSFLNIGEGSAERFTRMIIEKGHEAMLEHGGTITVRFIVDRGVSHEIVRSRVGFSFAQESTRYCNYNKERLGGGDITFISIEPMLNSNPAHSKEQIGELLRVWTEAAETSEKCYNKMIELGASPQEARSVLINSLKTDIVVSANPRAWRYFFRLRALGEAGTPHPQMLEATIPLLKGFIERWPVLFGDLKPENWG